ncbi:hypothetical protein ACFLQN_00855 [Candidatus Aenigmatarchaeota archaeon]
MAYELLITIAAGFAGGVLRAAIGTLKWQIRTNTRKKKFSPWYFLATFLLAGLMGLVAGLYIMNDPRFAILAGYAGTDFIDGVYKMRMKRHREGYYRSTKPK